MKRAFCERADEWKDHDVTKLLTTHLYRRDGLQDAKRNSFKTASFFRNKLQEKVDGPGVK
jgi:hypothetical protein